MDSKILLAKIDGWIENLASMTDAAAQTELFKAYLRTSAAFHEYSWGNQILIWMQRPDATRVAEFNTWKTLNRNVKKGAKGISILAPLLAKIKPDDPNYDPNDPKSSRLYGFRAVYVFDVSDTEGEPLPDLDVKYRADGDGSMIVAALESAAKEIGADIEYTDNLPEGTKGSSSSNHQIKIRKSMLSMEQAGTLAHELAHELLHHRHFNPERPPSKEQRELEAESVSYMVMQYFGVEQPSQFYLAAWNATATQIKDSLQTIRDTAKQIIDHITMEVLV